MSVISAIGILKPNGDRHRIPCVTFGVWCAHPGIDETMWRVSHGPTGKALFCNAADVDWWTAIRIAEEFHREFGDTMPTGSQARAVIIGVKQISDAFIESTDWTS